MSRLAFLGTPPAAVPSLRALVASGHDVRLVVTRSDTRRSRRGALEPSPVKAAALELGLEVTDDLEQVTSAGVELGVVVAYGRIIPARILEALPMINVHFSLLPRWRGAAPVERAILAGDEVTGVCLMRLEAGLDMGPVLSCAQVEISVEESARELIARLADLGARLLVDLLDGGVDSIGAGQAQEGEPTYAAKIDVSDLELDFDAPAEKLGRIVRAGRAWTSFRGSRLIVSRARPLPPPGPDGGPDPDGGADPGLPGTLEGTKVLTGDGWLELLEVQPEGRRPVEAVEWLRGARPAPGERLGT
jgi:methionyl-tRNA formyltransferase